MSTLDPFAVVLSRLEAGDFNPKKKGADKCESRCPAHNGGKHNLSIARGDDGRVLLNCFRGCSAQDVVSAIGLTMADLFPAPNGTSVKPKGETKEVPVYPSAEAAVASLPRRLGKPTGQWVYQDADGHEVARVYRFDPPDERKEFRPIHPQHDGWRITDPPGTWPLYHLPELAAAERVFVVEGEKVADLARSWGLVATTSAHGSQSPQNTDWRPLAGKEVVILPDHDDPGEKYVAKILELLAKLDPRPEVKVVRLEGLPEGGDLVEWAEQQGNDRATLERLVDTARPEDLDTQQVTNPPRNGRPEIVCGSCDPEDGFKRWTPLALAALKRINDPPSIFQQGGQLVRLNPAVDEDPPALEALSSDSLRGVLDRAASWGTIVPKKDGGTRVRYSPPRLDIVRDILSLAKTELAEIPRLEAIVETPRFLPDGRLLATPGYHETSRLYYAPTPDLAGLQVPDKPTDRDVNRALALIFDELLVDFPFANDASRANTLAVMLLPFVRFMIDGPTPLHNFEASTEGTGKGRLATVASLPALGRRLRSTPQKEDESEWRKAITTALMSGQSHVFIDNMYMPRGWDGALMPVDSAVLASALTERFWSDRILGGNQQANLKVNAVWLSSGNNVEFSRELARRLVPIRLDAGQERPCDRTGFRHELPEWAEANRRPLTEACLVLCQRWIADGRQPGRERMGSYEAYASTMGGILAAVGVPGFLENRASASEIDREAPRWRALVRAWHAKQKNLATSTGIVWEVITGDGGLKEAFIDIIGEGSDLSQKQRLGKTLARHADRVWGGFRIRRLQAESGTGNALYRLEPADNDSSA